MDEIDKIFKHITEIYDNLAEIKKTGKINLQEYYVYEKLGEFFEEMTVIADKIGE